MTPGDPIAAHRQKTQPGREPSSRQAPKRTRHRTMGTARRSVPAMLSSVQQALGARPATCTTSRASDRAYRTNSRTTTLTYDAAKRRVHRTGRTALSEQASTTPTAADSAGNTTQFAYDGLGHLLQAIDALGSNTGFAYDALGNLTSQTDMLANTTRLRCDHLGQCSVGRCRSATTRSLGRQLPRTTGSTALVLGPRPTPAVSQRIGVSP